MCDWAEWQVNCSTELCSHTLSNMTSRLHCDCRPPRSTLSALMVANRGRQAETHSICLDYGGPGRRAPLCLHCCDCTHWRNSSPVPRSFQIGPIWALISTGETHYGSHASLWKNTQPTFSLFPVLRSKCSLIRAWFPWMWTGAAGAGQMQISMLKTARSSLAYLYMSEERTLVSYFCFLSDVSWKHLSGTPSSGKLCLQTSADFDRCDEEFLLMEL